VQERRRRSTCGRPSRRPCRSGGARLHGLVVELLVVCALPPGARLRSPSRRSSLSALSLVLGGAPSGTWSSVVPSSPRALPLLGPPTVPGARISLSNATDTAIENRKYVDSTFNRAPFNLSLSGRYCNGDSRPKWRY
jgi:hypothetical protein